MIYQLILVKEINSIYYMEKVYFLLTLLLVLIIPKKILFGLLNLSYSVIGENLFREVGFNKSLTQENINNKIVYLNINLIKERNLLINFDEIPPQYMAVFLGTVKRLYIPSITRATKDYFQKRTANKHLKNILKEQNLSDNHDSSIKNLINQTKNIF